MAVEHKFTDEELLAWLKTSDSIDVPVRSLYEDYFFFLCTYVEQNNGSREDAEDVFQEVVLTFIQLVRLEKFRGESSVKTFLYALNRNIWLNELKKRDRRSKRHKEYSSMHAELDQDVQAQIAGRDSRKQVFEIIDSLGETCKKILLAFYYEKLSMTEILKHLDYQNEQVLRNKKSKCLKALNEKINNNPTLAVVLKNALRYE